MASFHDLRIGETLRLNGAGEVRVTLRAKSGRLARLEIAADEGVVIQPVADWVADWGDSDRMAVKGNANRGPMIVPGSG